MMQFVNVGIATTEKGDGSSNIQGSCLKKYGIDLQLSRNFRQYFVFICQAIVTYICKAME